MIARKHTSIVLVLASFGLVGLLPGAAQAAPKAAWDLSLTSQPTNFAPGAAASGPGVKALPQYTLVATNIGGAATSGTVTITDTLPDGLKPVSAAPPVGLAGLSVPISCGTSEQTITCTSPGPIGPGRSLNIQIPVEVEASLADPSTLTDTATVSGGGALAKSVTTTTPISSALPSFGFLDGRNGLGASLTDDAGQPATESGSHPYQMTVDLGFSTQAAANSLTGTDGGLRDQVAVLPPGLIANPNATPVLCTEAQLESSGLETDSGCPEASQVGVVTAITFLTGPIASQTPLYNMVTPPGTAALLGFNALNVGVFVHIEGGVRAKDNAIVARSRDIINRPANPVLGAQVQLWGDPSSSLHDGIRGGCRTKVGSCNVTPQKTPLISLPTSCTDSLSMEAEADSWGHPGAFAKAKGLFTDANGNATPVSGCDGVDFEASLRARPTTEAADSPAGLEARLHIPQTDDLSERATAHLRKAVVTLPEGLVVNPASANGLAGCSSVQIGLGREGPPSCPDAAKIGTVEVDTPLLDHSLPGAVYIASPFDNPFNSLLAIYIVVDDPQSGVVVKLPGHVVADPATGQLTTSFEENPQLPFEDFRLDFFGGSTATLRTPATCGTYTTTSKLTPWSAPASGPPATPSDTWSISSGPGGSACASSQAALPNNPSFEAGTLNPLAGAHTPFVLNLKRDDATQQFSSVSLVPPPGLLAKLAGTTYCSEAALAAAAGKTGNAEKASPSCPDSSRIGSVTVGAGAGPSPYYAQGTAYLTGPYKGAPLGMAIVTPAVAGPYDLGTVVVRTALNVDPVTTKITAVSDPIPTILQGIPLDVRSALVSLDRPDFTLNGTSCNPFSVDGTLVSTLGQSAALSNRFQLAECGRLGFKPKLSLRLKGATKRSGNPALRATLTMPEGGANIAKVSVALPHSEFLDQAHIRTVCTRVQFAVNACPAGAVYGHARAFSPLLDNPLEGPVYLRSSDHLLPDLVADLNGQIHVVLAGRIDSVKGGIRTTFEGVPDAPVSKFVLIFPGGRKGLLENSRNLCKSTNRAHAQFDAQNGTAYDFNPKLKAKCPKSKHKIHRRAHR